MNKRPNRPRKEGEQPVTAPAPKKSLLEWLATLEPWDEDFPEISDSPPEPVDVDL
jgi:antitoxin VapB